MRSKNSNLTVPAHWASSKGRAADSPRRVRATRRRLDGCWIRTDGHPQGVPLRAITGKVDVVWGEPGLSIRWRFPLEERTVADPVRWSETFNHPDVAVVDVAPYGEIAAVRRRYAPN
jgi:hypothetical protein